ncbi:hypothetical protein NDU88_007526 [Pleurodeles waltl]|uniref:Uncharacterized protein n=1 Tax=Pleurodeles waltl TaxID=8319 RepID=A0AAV7U2J4_PLEWA|nr:hypothetical protein NDU88_007526 [Pleurodeles waltl]
MASLAAIAPGTGGLTAPTKLYNTMSASHAEGCREDHCTVSGHETGVAALAAFATMAPGTGGLTTPTKLHNTMSGHMQRNAMKPFVAPLGAK